MLLTELNSISPIDGRYRGKTDSLSAYFSEYALIKYRVWVEIEYFKALCRMGLPQLKDFSVESYQYLDAILNGMNESDAQKIKDIEKTTNHDVKAVEYYLKEQFDRLGLSQYKEFIHFGLTSQDINNTATPAMMKDALETVIWPSLESLIDKIESHVTEYRHIPLLARTHGQPASPTLLGKEFEVFSVRLREQLKQWKAIPFSAKFGGATGNMNAHMVSYPNADWRHFAEHFVNHDLGLKRSSPTTQIEHYDNLAASCHAAARINTILIDFCRDIWTYISMDYFKQKVVAGEVGSSAMPHKVNPIDFENAEGNLGLANALFEHLAAKLPISRLQRDLTDSTVLRNLGVPFSHMLISIQSIEKGLGKLLVNEGKIREDLENSWMVVAEAIQNILRREGYPSPYEALKALTRGKAAIGQADIHEFVHSLEIGDGIKEELLKITPFNYVGLD